MARQSFHTLEVADVERLCDDAVAVTFAVPDDLEEAYRFAPGQSLTLRRNIDGGEQRRSYSICAPAGHAPRVGVRLVPDGAFSTWLVHEVAPGDAVDVGTPTGAFTPDLETPAHHVLIGAGSGITPLLSIAGSVLADDRSRVTLLYGNRRADTVMFAEDVADLKDRHPARFSIAHVLSREPREAELFTGRLDAAKLRQLLPRLLDVDGAGQWWLCGPYEMVEEARGVLTEMGVLQERVHTELFFVGDLPPEPNRHVEQPIDGPSAKVTVVLDGRTTALELETGTTVLDGAQRVRPDLPFACRGGVCGTCRAKVVDGEVAMRRNFALEPGEVEAGFVLTCQSVPLTEAVTVDYDA